MLENSTTWKEEQSLSLPICVYPDPNACRRHEISASWIPGHVLGDLKVKVKVAQLCPTLCDPMEQSIEFSLDYISPLIRTQ